MTLRTEAKRESPAVQKPAEVYDFRRPTTLARDHSRALELAFETFARQWGTQLTSKVRVRSQVTFETVVMSSYDEYAASLPGTTAMTLLAIDGVDAKAVVQFPAQAALSWFDHMLGGTGTHSEPERTFTSIERAILQKLIDDTIDDLKYSLGPLLSPTLSIESVHHNSQFAQAAATAELMIVASFAVQTGENLAPATIAIPADVLLRHLADANPVVTTTNARALVTGQLADVPLGVALQLPATPVTPQTILGLAVGDVIPLNHPQHKPLELAVGGYPLASAAIGADGARLACLITDIQESPR